MSQNREAFPTISVADIHRDFRLGPHWQQMMSHVSPEDRAARPIGVIDSPVTDGLVAFMTAQDMSAYNGQVALTIHVDQRSFHVNAWVLSTSGPQPSVVYDRVVDEIGVAIQNDAIPHRFGLFLKMINSLATLTSEKPKAIRNPGYVLTILKSQILTLQEEELGL